MNVKTHISKSRFFDPDDIKIEATANTEVDVRLWLESKRNLLTEKNPQADINWSDPDIYGDFEKGFKGVQYFHMTLIRC
jgi:hypothetical protein